MPAKSRQWNGQWLVTLTCHDVVWHVSIPPAKGDLVTCIHCGLPAVVEAVARATRGADRAEPA